MSTQSAYGLSLQLRAARWLLLFSLLFGAHSLSKNLGATAGGNSPSGIWHMPSQEAQAKHSLHLDLEQLQQLTSDAEELDDTQGKDDDQGGAVPDVHEQSHHSSGTFWAAATMHPLIVQVTFLKDILKAFYQRLFSAKLSSPSGLRSDPLPLLGRNGADDINERDGDDSRGARAKAKLQGLPLIFIENPLPILDENNADVVLESILDVYSEPVCAGAEGFARGGTGGAPSTFCRYTNKQPNWTIDGHTLEFDQFALERIMLGRWADSPRRCIGDGNKGDWCRKKADVIVVPSVELHTMLAEGPSWESVQQTWWRNKDQLSWRKMHTRYWSMLMQRYYKPSVPGKHAEHTPILVVHASFTNIVAQLLALAEMPAEFSSRVVLATLETNLRRKQQELLPSRAWWGNGPYVELGQRAAARKQEQDDVQQLVQGEQRIRAGTFLAARPIEAAEFQIVFDMTAHNVATMQANILSFARKGLGGSAVSFNFLPGTTRMRVEVRPPPGSVPGVHPDGYCDTPSQRGELELGRTFRVRARLQDGVFAVSIDGKAACYVVGAPDSNDLLSSASVPVGAGVQLLAQDNFEGGHYRHSTALKVWVSTAGTHANATIAGLTYARLKPVRPLLVTMPYPTSILQSNNFGEQELFQKSGAKTSVAERSSAWPRSIAVSLLADPEKTSGKENWIRSTMFAQLSKHSARKSGLEVGNPASHAFVCAPGSDGKSCGLRGGLLNMWDITANSAFCLEPAGDTPTRSHFYVAVLSGCIPVIFDGGHDGFDGSLPTWWAWRRSASSTLKASTSDASPFVDFSEFAVVYNASTVGADKEDIVQELLDMPTKDPDRFWALRRGLDRIGPLMRYAPRDCKDDCNDAFAAFEQIVNEEWKAKEYHDSVRAA